MVPGQQNKFTNSTLNNPSLISSKALGFEFQRFAPEMVATLKVSAYRIHRDTRFSKDKSPCKTHVAAVFPHSRLGKHEGAGFYLQIAPTELFIGGGLNMPLPEDLGAVRQRIANNPAEFMKVEARKIRERQKALLS
jgi:uncharacterized protein (TIGR02453 family)